MCIQAVNESMMPTCLTIFTLACRRKIPACPENDLLKSTLSPRVYKAVQEAYPTSEPTHTFALLENKVVRKSIYSVRLERIPDLSIDWLDLPPDEMYHLDGVDELIAEEGNALVHEVRELIRKIRRLLEESKDLRYEGLSRYLTNFGPFLAGHTSLTNRVKAFLSAYNSYSKEMVSQGDHDRQLKFMKSLPFKLELLMAPHEDMGMLIGLLEERVQRLATAALVVGNRDISIEDKGFYIELDLALITSRLDEVRQAVEAKGASSIGVDQAERVAVRSQLDSLLQDAARVKSKYDRYIEDVDNSPGSLTTAFSRFESSVASAQKAVETPNMTTIIDSTSVPSPSPEVLAEQVIIHKSSDSLPPAADTDLSDDEAQELDDGEDEEGPAYPPGSIVAHVTVEYTADERIEVTQTDTGERTETASRRKSLFTYTGCISGQVELDWQVTNIA